MNPGARPTARVASTVTGSVAALVARHAGRERAAAALAALLRAVDEADAHRGRVVLSGDLLSCFAAVPGPGGTMTLRAFWYVDATSNRKVVVRVQRDRVHAAA